MEYHLITEDSGSGLSFWKLLNSALFNDQLQLDKAMIYDKKSSIMRSSRNNRDLVRFFEETEFSEEQYYFILFDSANGNPEVYTLRTRLQKALHSKLNGRYKLFNLQCFEEIFFSYSNLPEKVFCPSTKLRHLYQELINFVNVGNADLSILSADTRDYIEDCRPLSTEKIITKIVTDICNRNYWFITKSVIGACWIEDCTYESTKNCSLCCERVLSEKLIDLCDNSLLGTIVEEIELIISN